MKGGNKIFLKCLILLLFAVFMLFILQLKADDEKFEGNQEQSIDTKKKNNTINEEYSVPSANKSFINLELFQLAKKKYKHGKIKLNLDQDKNISVSTSQRFIPKRNKLQELEKSLYITSLITLITLNIADYFSTIKASEYKDLKEFNPVIRPLVKNPPLYFILKLGVNAYTLYSMEKLYEKNKKLAWVISTVANVALSYIVFNNIRQINQSKAR